MSQNVFVSDSSCSQCCHRNRQLSLDYFDRGKEVVQSLERIQGCLQSAKMLQQNKKSFSDGSLGRLTDIPSSFICWYILLSVYRLSDQ